MCKIKYLPANEKGSVIVVALMMMVLLTILGLAAINTSSTEQHLAVNTLLYERAFYAADSGLEYAKGILKVPYTEQNQVDIATGGDGNWTFVLDGLEVIPGLAAAYDSDGDGVGDFDGGVVLVQSELDGIDYTVTVWNNDDGGGPTNDADGRLMIRTKAKGPRGATSTIEALIKGDTRDPGGIDGYKAQAGAGAGKSYRNNDLEAITVFTQQM